MVGEEFIDTLDIRKFVVIPREIPLDEIRSVATENGFELNPTPGFETGLYTLDIYGVPHNEYEETIEKVQSVSEHIKNRQIELLELEKDNIQIESKLSGLVARFITQSNNNFGGGSDKAFLLLQSVLGDLQTGDIDGVNLLDTRTLGLLANATVSKSPQEAENNIISAMKETLIQIRKISLLLMFETISVTLVNIRPKKGKVIPFDDTNTFLDRPHELIQIPMGHTKETIAFAESELSIIAFNMGKKKQNALIPFIFNTVLQKSSQRFRISYTNIILTAMERIEEEAYHQMSGLEYNFSKASVKDIEKIQKITEETMNFYYRMTLSFRNQILNLNQQLRITLKGSYTRNINRFVGGAISEKIRTLSPLSLLPAMEEQETRMDANIKRTSKLKSELISKMEEIKQAKIEQNPFLVKKIWNECKDLLSKTGAELMDKQLKR